MHAKKGDQICNFLLVGILEANGKAIFWDFKLWDK